MTTIKTTCTFIIIKQLLMTRYTMHLLVFLCCVTTAQAQWIDYQTIKIEYDARGNRIIRKLYDPFEEQNKRSTRELQAAQGDGIEAFPNPAGSEVWLRLAAADSQCVEIIVYNTTGQRVAAAALMPGTTTKTLDLRSLPPGIYHVQAATENRKRSLTIIHQ